MTRIGLYPLPNGRTKANAIHVTSNVNPNEVLDGLGINMNDSDLTADQKHELVEFLSQNREAFAKDTTELGTTYRLWLHNLTSYVIDCVLPVHREG